MFATTKQDPRRRPEVVQAGQIGTNGANVRVRAGLPSGHRLELLSPGQAQRESTTDPRYCVDCRPCFFVGRGRKFHRHVTESL